MSEISFHDMAIVSCGTVSLELNHLKQAGFLDTEHVFYTTPGLHEDVKELERQLVSRIQKAKQLVDKVIVVYGGKFCYINADQPTRTMQTIIEEQGSNVTRINATHCMDMVASEEQREQIVSRLCWQSRPRCCRGKDRFEPHGPHYHIS